jgi:hypothetical protein
MITKTYKKRGFTRSTQNPRRKRKKECKKGDRGMEEIWGQEKLE